VLVVNVCFQESKRKETTHTHTHTHTHTQRQKGRDDARRTTTTDKKLCNNAFKFVRFVSFFSSDFFVQNEGLGFSNDTLNSSLRIGHRSKTSEREHERE